MEMGGKLVDGASPAMSVMARAQEASYLRADCQGVRLVCEGEWLQRLQKERPLIGRRWEPLPARVIAVEVSNSD